MDLFTISQLNVLENQCDELQKLIDHARAAFPDNGEWQYAMDLQQTALDEERKRVMDAKALFISSN